MKIPLTLTVRGFVFGEFTDLHGRPCFIQKSSPGSPDCVWLGGDGSPMHLTREMVAALLPLLRAFVETGELPVETRP